MKALMRDRYGPPDVLEVREIERPAPKEREVLVRVHAALNQRLGLADAPAAGASARLQNATYFGFWVPISGGELPRSAGKFSVSRSETKSTVICLASGLAAGADSPSMCVRLKPHW